MDQDLRVGGAKDWAKTQSESDRLGSFPNQDVALANQFSPPAQLRYPIPAGHDLPQIPLVEGGNFQWSRRMLKVLLDLLGQLKQVHDLGYTSPRKALSGGDFRLAEARVLLHFLTPKTGL